MKFYEFENIVDSEVIKKVIGKNILIHGFNYETKIVFLWFQSKRIYINGFLLNKDQRNIEGIKFLNKPMFFVENLKSSKKDFVIIDVLGKDVENLREKFSYPIYKLFKTKPIILYGDIEGLSPKYACELLKKFGVSILKFCDPNKSNEGKTFIDTEIISPGTLQKNYPNENIVAVGELKKWREGVKEISLPDEVQNMKNLFVFNHDSFSLPTLINKVYGVYAPILHYYIESATLRGKKLFCYGKTKEVVEKLKSFKLIDISVTGISSENFVDGVENFTFISPYDLIYEDQTDYMILVVEGDEYSARVLMSESGINPSIFLCSYTGERLEFDICLDPNLGYNLKKSVIVYPFKDTTPPLSYSSFRRKNCPHRHFRWFNFRYNSLSGKILVGAFI